MAYNGKTVGLTKLTLSVMLLLSIAPFLLLIPSASTQALSSTTSTSVAYSNTFTIRGAIGYPEKTCYYNYIELGTEWEGTKLFGSISATNSIDFGILNSAQFSRYSTGPGWRGAVCRFTAQSVLSPGTRFSQYSFNWTVPDGDDYYFVFFNPNDVDVQITLDVWTIAISTITSTSTRQSSTLVSSSSQASNTQVSVTQVSVTQSNQQTGLALTSFQNLSTVAQLLAALIVVCLVIIGALIIARLRASKPVSAKKRRATGRQAEKGAQFCINCGAELTPKSKFCNKCGSAQG
jgi:hypothetical protein